MDSQKITFRFAVIAVLIFSAAFCRIIPHMPNFSPLAAIGLFGAARFVKKWQAFLIPITAIWLSDLFINNVIYGQYYPKFTWFYEGFYWQYGSYLLITLAGIFIFKKLSAKRVMAGVIIATAIFFLVSNFGSWIGKPTYPQNVGGLITCYIAGIPFLKGTLLGDLCYSAVLFGSFALAQLRFPVLQIAYCD